MQQRTSLVSRLCLFRQGSLKTIVLDMDNTLLVAGDDHDTVSLTFQPYLGEFLAMLLRPRAFLDDTYCHSKVLETGRSGQGLWSVIDCSAHMLDSCFPLGPLRTCHLLLCIGSFTFTIL